MNNAWLTWSNRIYLNGHYRKKRVSWIWLPVSLRELVPQEVHLSLLMSWGHGGNKSLMKCVFLSSSCILKCKLGIKSVKLEACQPSMPHMLKWNCLRICNCPEKIIPAASMSSSVRIGLRGKLCIHIWPIFFKHVLTSNLSSMAAWLVAPINPASFVVRLHNQLYSSYVLYKCYVSSNTLGICSFMGKSCVWPIWPLWPSY